MAQSTLLAAGTTAATSTDVVLAAGASATVGLFAATGAFSVSGPVAVIKAATPGADVDVAVLSTNSPTTVISGPGTFRVVRGPVSQAIGIYAET